MNKLLTPEEWLQNRYDAHYKSYLIISENDMKGYAEYVRDFTLDFAAENATTYYDWICDIEQYHINKDSILSLKDCDELKIK